MIARIHGCGRGTRGLVAYVTHNQNSPQNSPPSTAAGVGFAESVNFLQCAPQLAGLIMARTAADAEFLKRESGHLDQGPEIEEAVRPLQPQSGRAGVVADHPADRLRLEVDVTRACRRPPRLSDVRQRRLRRQPIKFLCRGDLPVHPRFCLVGRKSPKNQWVISPRFGRPTVGPTSLCRWLALGTPESGFLDRAQPLPRLSASSSRRASSSLMSVGHP